MTAQSSVGISIRAAKRSVRPVRDRESAVTAFDESASATLPSDFRHRSVTLPLVPRPRRLRWIAALVALAAVLAAHDVAHADHDGPAAQQAAREIQEARDRADAAAQALFDAELRLETLDAEITDATRRVGELEAEVVAMRGSLSEMAVRRYTAGGVSANPLLGSISDANADAAAAVLTSVATGGMVVDVDEFDERIDELDDARAELEQRRADEVAARDDFERLRSDAEAEIVRLQQVEAERVRDAEVQHALERQRAEQRAREQAEREAREQAEREAREQAEREANSGGGSGAANGSGGPGPGSPSAPVVSAGLACPVAGAVGFSDTWGAARSGGRSHEGVDMIAAGGTPLVAMEAGTASFRTNGLGGNTVSLQGASGTRYYYAHLSAWEGSSRPVTRGEVIGYVGKTGNTTVNHLHLQVHPGGGLAVNPYPYARGAC